MTPKFSLTAVIGVAALLLVPAAWGQGQQDFVRMPDVVERAAAQQAQARTFNGSPDAMDRANAAQGVHSTLTGMPDLVERTASAASTSGRTLVFDNYRVTAPVAPPTTPDGGRNIEWPQIGVGFAIGILLALSLVFALRGLRIRSLAH